MRRRLVSLCVLGLLSASMVEVFGSKTFAATDDDQAVLSADRALVQAIGRADKKVLVEMLDRDFTWTDSKGSTFTKAEVAKILPSPIAGYDAEAKERTYGEVGTIQASSGKTYVLRLWVKRASGWRALAYHEVVQLDAPPTAGPGVKDCENPCKAIPYEPKNKDEQAIITSWQELETAVTTHDSAGWSPHAAEEFIQVSSNNDHPLDKAARMAVIDKQKQSGAASAPAPLESAQMFDFGETVVMKALHQPYHGKPIRVSRVWVKRDGKWVMAISYQTTIQSAPAKDD
jgi:hypothetical protein